MKKLLLVPALLLSSALFASDYDYEITPLVGYNIAEGNINLDNYPVYGAEFQYNGLDSAIKPELSFLYSKADYNYNTLDYGSMFADKKTDIWRVALNGVYEFDKVGSVTPLVKAGAGYENMNNTGYNSYNTKGNTNSPFIDAGVGAKVALTDMIALKLEALYMLKYNDSRYDNNLAVLAGLNIAFGKKAAPEAPAPAPIVDGDDDNDGVLNSVDECPTTPAGERVDAKGCTIVEPAPVVVDGDDDNDGVLNSVDKCPNTPAGDAVNSDGCSYIVNLHINFENDSYAVDSASHEHINKFASFLNKYENYSAIIIGHTDSKASEKYNQKLSQRRADAVKNLIIEQGVSKDRVSTRGEGELSPIADNSTKEGRAQNRRIEAKLIKN